MGMIGHPFQRLLVRSQRGFNRPPCACSGVPISTQSEFGRQVWGIGVSRRATQTTQRQSATVSVSIKYMILHELDSGYDGCSDSDMLL